MNPIIAKYATVREDADLVYCSDLAYQRDMSRSVEYGQGYYENYVGRENTEIARRLNEARTRMTERFCRGPLLDVGVGSGEFITSSRLKVFGYDINPWGVRWLNDRGLFLNPYDGLPPEVDGLTMWDTFEHIPDPTPLLERVGTGCRVFISLPTFASLDDVRGSKHYKPDEHYYYFTVPGVVRVMADAGFRCLEVNDEETKAGREGITAFAFGR